MARRSMQSSSIEVQDSLDSFPPALPDGFMPGTVAPFVMRYGTDFLVAMQRAASHDHVATSKEAETA
jgi:hypothetical protein